MAVKQLSHGVWYSTFAGHRFDNQEDAEAFDEKQRGRHPVQSGTPFLDSLSAEQLKAAITELDSEPSGSRRGRTGTEFKKNL